MLNRKLVGKSCKMCVALLIGIIVAYGVSKLLEKEKGDKEKDKEKDKAEDCGCSA